MNKNLYTYKIVTFIERGFIKHRLYNTIRAILVFKKFERIYLKKIRNIYNNSEIIEIFKSLYKEYYYIKGTVLTGVDIEDPLKSSRIDIENEEINTTVYIDEVCSIYLSHNFMTDDIVIFIKDTKTGNNYNIDEDSLKIKSINEAAVSTLNYFMHGILKLQLSLIFDYGKTRGEKTDV